MQLKDGTCIKKFISDSALCTTVTGSFNPLSTSYSEDVRAQGPRKAKIHANRLIFYMSPVSFVGLKTASI